MAVDSKTTPDRALDAIDYVAWTTRLIEAATNPASGKFQRVKEALFDFEDRIKEVRNVR